MRDYRAADTIRLAFNTNSSTGAAVTMTSPTAKLYADGGTTEITTGLTITTDFDGVTGAHMLTIDGATAGLVPGSTYRALVSATVSGVSVVAWVGAFTVLAQGGDIVSRGQLSAGGAGAFTLPGGQRDRVKIGDAIRIVSGTGYGYRPILTYNSTTGAGTVSAWDVNAVAGDYYEVVSLPNPEVLAATDFADGFITSAKILDAALTNAKFAADAISASKVAADVTTEIQSGLALASALATAQTALTNIQSRIPAALVGGKIDAALDSTGLADGAITAAKIGANAITAAKVATDAIGAAQFAADAVTKVTTGLATSAAQTTAQSSLTSISGRLPAALVSGKMSIDPTGLATSTAQTTAQTSLTSIDSRLPAALVSGKMDSTATVDTTGLATSADQATLLADTSNIKSRLPAALVTGKMDAVATVDTTGLATSAAMSDVQSRLPAALVGGKMDSTATATVDTDAIATAVFAHAVESGLTFDDFCKLLGALYVGKTTGITTTSPTFSSADISGGVVVGTKTRITATRDADNNRLTLSFDLTP